MNSTEFTTSQFLKQFGGSSAPGADIKIKTTKRF